MGAVIYSGSVLAIAQTMGTGRKTVTAAGTREKLSATSVQALKVIIQALAANTSAIVVGGDAVVAAAGTRQGIALNPGDTMVLDFWDLSGIYIDSEVNGEGVSYAYLAA